LTFLSRAALTAFALLALCSPASADSRDPINGYKVKATPANLEKLALAGYDMTEGRDQREGTVEIFGSARQIAELRTDQRITARLIEDKQGRSTSERQRDRLGGKAAPEDYTGSDATYDVWRRFDRVPGDGKEQYLELNDRVQTENPTLVKTVDLGDTYLGRDVVAMKVTKDAPTTADGTRPAVLFSALQHAREWLAGETCARTLKYFTENYGEDTPTGDIVTPLVDSRELWFVCVASPDGYEYTFTPDNRLWRKNMADNDNDGIHGELNDGVDPNRNFPRNWGLDDEGSSPEPDTETYRGPSAGSEPETKAMIKLMDMVDFAFQKNDHTAAELLLYPQGFQQYTPTADNAIFTALAGDDVNSAIADREPDTEDGPGEITGNRFDPDVGAELYITNGDTNDYAYRDKDILSYTPEGTEADDVNVSGFEFADDEAAIEAEFQRHRRFSLDLVRSAADPANPSSHLGNTAENFYVDSFRDSYGDPQPVQVTAKRSLGELTLRYRINGGKVRKAKTSEFKGGERYYLDDSVYYHRVRGNVTGTDPGDSVEAWFENASGSRSSSHFTYAAREESKAPVLIMAAENYKAGLPAQDPSGPKYLSFYTDALDAVGLDYDVYDVDARDHRAPHPLGVLSHYQAVIWYTGDDILTRIPGQGPGTGTARLALEDQVAVRDYLNEGGKLFFTGKNAGQEYADGNKFRNQGFPEPRDGAGGEFCNKNGTDFDPSTPDTFDQWPEFDEDDPSQADGCLAHTNDFLQYYLGAYVYASGGSSSDPDTGDLYPIIGEGAFAPGIWGFDSATGAGNQDHSATFVVTSTILDPAKYPLFASSKRLGAWLRPGAAPFSPFSGDHYAAANADSASYKRLSQTIDLTGKTTAELDFKASYDLEQDYDYLFVEVHTVGQDDYTTLPEVNGNTSDDTGASCTDGWQQPGSSNPFIRHYQTRNSPDDCDPVGTIGTPPGAWNAATGSSGGWQDWKIDLSAYAGKQIEVSIVNATDPAVLGLGVWVDDAKVTVDGATLNETSFEDDLGAWGVTDPPDDTNSRKTGWERDVEQFKEGGIVGTTDTVYTGFGFEGIGASAKSRGSAAGERADFMRETMEYLGVLKKDTGAGPGGNPGTPSPGTPTPTPAKPTGTPLTIAKTKALRARKGKVRIRVSCPRRADRFCKGTLRLRAGKRTLGTKRYQVSAGKSKTITVRLTKSARKLLSRKRGRMRVTVSATSVDASGVRRRSSRRLTLRRVN